MKKGVAMEGIQVSEILRELNQYSPTQRVIIEVKRGTVTFVPVVVGRLPGRKPPSVNSGSAGVTISETLLNISEAAILLGIDVQQMYRHIQHDRLPRPAVRLGRRYYYQETQLVKLKDCLEKVG